MNSKLHSLSTLTNQPIELKPQPPQNKKNSILEYFTHKELTIKGANHALTDLKNISHIRSHTSNVFNSTFDTQKRVNNCVALFKHLKSLTDTTAYDNLLNSIITNTTTDNDFIFALTPKT